MINKISKYNISHFNNLDNNNNNNLDNNLHTNYDDILFVLFLLSILLNINLISKYKYNKANYKYKKINNKIKKKSVEIQTEPEFISIILNPNDEYGMLK
tara:strand:+ start:369 stop:665 length:297 start_codon:yes stop_codon:yes gene_type:complete